MLSLALGLGACGQSTTTNDAATQADATLDGASVDAFFVGDSGIVCSGHDAASFPTFDRHCTHDTDCTIAQHQTDCCGSIQALGIATTETARFADDEAICEGQYPACGCASGTLQTDDGAMAPRGSGVAAVVVRCVTGTCTTSVRPSMPCGAATCSPTQACVMECSGVDAGPLPSHCVDVPPACAISSDCACFGLNDPCPTGMCVGVSHGAPVCMCA
jgi:hypothetical protein